MRRPHVALFMNSLMMGGAERVVLAVMRQLIARQDMRVDIVLSARQGPLVAEIPAGAKVIELGTAGAPRMWRCLLGLPWSTARLLPAPFLRDKPPKAIRSLPHLARYLREQRPDGLLTTLPYNNLAALWAAALAGGGTRIVVREANTFSREVGHTGKPFDARVPALVARWYREAAGIVAVSDGVAEDLSRSIGLPRQRITTIHNPVDVARIATLAEAPVEDEWLRPAHPPVIVAAGRLAPQKDYPTLLRAFALVAANRPCRLVVLGEGQERPNLEALAHQLGISSAVRMPGAVANPYPCFRHAAVFVLSSAWEGFPNVLVEALACGCPVVSTDCPSGPQEVLAAGRFGRLVPPGDHERLAAAILVALDDPRGAAARIARARHFSLEKAAGHYLELLLGQAP